MAGRPTAYTEELGKRIFLFLADGGSIRQMEKVEGMPCKATLYNWMGEPGHPILDIVTRGKALGRVVIAEMIQENCMKLADQADNPNSLLNERKIDVANRGLKMYMDVTAPKKDWSQPEQQGGVLEVPAIVSDDDEMARLEEQELEHTRQRKSVKNEAG